MADRNKRKNEILEKIKKNYDSISMFLIPVILTALLEGVKGSYNEILNLKGETETILVNEFSWVRFVLFIIGIIIYIILSFFVLFLNGLLRRKLFNTPNEEMNMKNAFLRLKEFGHERQMCFRTDSLSKFSDSKYADFLVAVHKDNIDLAVSTCLKFFTNSFSEQRNLVSDISFEVSFMTKSFIDDKITIVSSDNNKHRTPPSMLLRNLNPEIYDKTETGKIYESYSANPSEALTIRIIENCSTQNTFTALYEGQKDNIRSMAILPVLSPQNELLGTLVICANQVNFFKEKDRHFWNELLEIFSVELGYHFLALKNCIRVNGDILSEQYKKPF